MQMIRRYIISCNKSGTSEDILNYNLEIIATISNHSLMLNPHKSTLIILTNRPQSEELEQVEHSVTVKNLPLILIER